MIILNPVIIDYLLAQDNNTNHACAMMNLISSFFFSLLLVLPIPLLIFHLSILYNLSFVAQTLPFLLLFHFFEYIPQSTNQPIFVVCGFCFSFYLKNTTLLLLANEFVVDMCCKLVWIFNFKYEVQ